MLKLHMAGGAAGAECRLASATLPPFVDTGRSTLNFVTARATQLLHRYSLVVLCHFVVLVSFA